MSTYIVADKTERLMLREFFQKYPFVCAGVDGRIHGNPDFGSTRSFGAAIMVSGFREKRHWWQRAERNGPIFFASVDLGSIDKKNEPATIYINGYGLDARVEELKSAVKEFYGKPSGFVRCAPGEYPLEVRPW